ncbi:chemotaxis protein CheW [Cereibacter sphaeroides]|nr:chemotaxis protein CheW [Cereibacter sphaeroides]
MDGATLPSRRDAVAPDEDLAERSTPIALVELGALTIGIDVGDLREVMLAPAVFDPLPTTAPGVIGSATLRGRVIPVVDLAPLLGFPALHRSDDRSAPGVVVIVGAGEEAYGILADDARQIVPRAQCQPQGMVRRGEALTDRLLPTILLIDQRSIGVLDATVLPGLGIPMARGGRVRRQRRDSADQFLIFQLGTRRFGLPLGVIAATLPEIDIDPSVLRSGPSEGGVTHLGTERALVNLAVLLGFGATNSGGVKGRASSILMSYGERGSLALRADRVCDIRSFSADEIAPMPSLLSGRPDMFRGLNVDPEAGETFLLDGEKLHADPVLGTLSELAHPVIEAGSDPRGVGHDGPTEQSTGHKKGRRTVALLVEAGLKGAFVLEDVREIVERPALSGDDGGDTYLGTMALRDGGLIPVFALAPLFGHPQSPRQPGAAVVVVQRDGERVGLAIDAVCGVEPMAELCPESGSEGAILERRRGDDQTYWEVIRPSRLPLMGGQGA